MANLDSRLKKQRKEASAPRPDPERGGRV